MSFVEFIMEHTERDSTGVTSAKFFLKYRLISLTAYQLSLFNIKHSKLCCSPFNLEHRPYRVMIPRTFFDNRGTLPRTSLNITKPNVKIVRIRKTVIFDFAI